MQHMMQITLNLRAIVASYISSTVADGCHVHRFGIGLVQGGELNTWKNLNWRTDTRIPTPLTMYM
jgi:hypothetical protein